MSNINDLVDVPPLPEGYDASIDLGWPIFSDLIGSQEGEVPYINISRGVSVPQSFTVTVLRDPFDPEDPASNWVLMLHFLVDPASREFRLPHVTGVPGSVDVLLDRVKRVRPIQWWLDWARRNFIVDQLPELDSVALEEVAKAIPLQPRKRSNRTRARDSELKQVAEIYRRARENERPVKEAVAKEFPPAHLSTAARWIKRARDAGYID